MAGTSHPDLNSELDRWVTAGLLTDDQARAILAHETASLAPVAPPPSTAGGRRRIPAIAEALGYLGGAFALAGLVLIVGNAWPDLAMAGRLLVSGIAAVGLVGAGFVAPERADPALARLRWFLWLAGTAAAALFAGVVAVDGLDAEGETVALFAAGTVAVVAGLLWRGEARPLQQLSFLAALVVSAGAATALVATDVPTGIAVWAVGMVLVAAGLRAWMPEPTLAVVVGAPATMVGTIIVVSSAGQATILFLVANAFLLVALAAVPGAADERVDRLVLGVIGAFMLVQGAPGAIAWYSREAGVVTGMVVWVIGGLVMASGARGLVRLPVPAELLGALGLLVGPAVTARQWEGFAPLFGIATAVALIALGTLPGQVLLSLAGSVGLLVNVPWAISHFVPGEGLAPLLIMVTGALLIGLAVHLTRRGRGLRDDLELLGRPPTPRRHHRGHHRGGGLGHSPA